MNSGVQTLWAIIPWIKNVYATEGMSLLKSYTYILAHFTEFSGFIFYWPTVNNFPKELREQRTWVNSPKA